MPNSLVRALCQKLNVEKTEIFTYVDMEVSWISKIKTRQLPWWLSTKAIEATSTVQ